jgi:Ca-activated chloride channel family protein
MNPCTRNAPRGLVAGALALSLLALAAPLSPGGTLTPRGSADAPIQILDHHVEVTLNNGFARTEVSQSFFNPNARDLEAIYSFPVPKSASLAEMTVFAGEAELHGEVVREDEARRVYEEARSKGEDAGLAEKNAYLSYEFFVARVPAQAETRFRFVYYQPLEIDTGIGRFVYPLEEGGTDDVALSFWDTEREVRRSFSFHLVLRSTVPVDDVRMPGFEAAAKIDKLEDGWWDVTVASPGGLGLDRDLVVYYRLADGLPGSIDLVPFRDDTNAPGTFMLVVTPGIDLAPLTNGADYLFVLDVSGSMQGKLQTLVDGVVRAMGELRPEDRFEIIEFSNDARSVTRGKRAATRANVDDAIAKLRKLNAQNGTNLYSALALATKNLDADRATSVVLVTDAVANQGELDPARFHDLMKSHDVRVFGMLMGNGGNWPLMRTICDASGGFYKGISNADDVVGQLLLARSKITHECLHDAEVVFDGVNVHDVTRIRSKVYRGQQLVLFGRYSVPGPLEVQLKARLTGQDRVYRAFTVLPSLDTENPELERLWALDRIEELECAIDRGAMDASEGKHAIADLGVAYQLVTDETSMLVLDDAAFAQQGIARDNQERVAKERAAQSTRASSAPRSYRVDASQPAFPAPAPSTRGSSGGGGLGAGAVDPLTWLLGLLVAGAAVGTRRPTS